MTKLHFASYSEARTHFRDVLDAAQSGRVTTVQRDREKFAVVNGEVLRSQLMALVPCEVVVTAEGGGWSAFIPGTPIAGEANDFDDAIDDLIVALREYATDWNDRLLTAPNHRMNWALVMVAELCTDDQLKEWMLRSDKAVAQ